MAIMTLSQLVFTMLIGQQALAHPSLLQPREAPQPGANATSFFAAITPSEQLNWVPCVPSSVNKTGLESYDGFECARLLAPLDYSNPDGTAGQVSIAAMRLPATDKKDYKGPVFLNPGGPGYAGSVFLPTGGGKDWQENLGAGYDIVTWDPRATGSTLPALSCYVDEEHRKGASAMPINLLFQSNNTLEEMDAMNQVLATGCEKHSGHILPYMGTTATTRDLHRLVEAYGYSKKISFFGGSYGTVVGQTYAVLFPNEIDRMVLDGVTDVKPWFQDDYLADTFADTDSILNEFFHLCYVAGPGRCKAWRSSEAAIKEDFVTLDNRLRNNPIAVSDSEGFTWSKWRTAVLNFLYAPYSSFTGPTGLDNLLEMACNGSLKDAEKVPMAAGISMTGSQPLLSDPTTGFTNGFEGKSVISCADHRSYAIGDLQELKTYFRSPAVTDLGFIVQSIAPMDGLLCGRMNMTTSERLSGTLEEIETSNPILFVSNRLDPVTPYRHAKSASARFVNSALLVNNATGHVATSTPGSTCIASKVAAYFNHGTLPPNGTLCQLDFLPFDLALDGTPVDQTNSSSLEGTSGNHTEPTLPDGA